MYTGPITIDHSATLFAVAYRQGFAPSPTATATYLVGPPVKPGYTSFVATSHHRDRHCLWRIRIRAGWIRVTGLCHGGAPAVGNMETVCRGSREPSTRIIVTKHGGDVSPVEANWDQTLAALTKVDQFCLEVNSVDVDVEATYDIKFFDALRENFPTCSRGCTGSGPRCSRPPGK